MHDSSTQLRATAMLARSEVFKRLDPALLADIARLGTVVSQPPKATIFYKDDEPDAMYGVMQGKLRVVSWSEQGDETELARLGPGALFGEIALLDGRPRSATVIAQTRCVLLRVPRRPFLELLRVRPPLALALLAALAQYARSLSGRIEEDALLSAKARLWRQLQRLGEQHGKPTDRGLLIDEHLPQASLASALGLSRQTVNRHLQELQAEGRIEVRRARVTLRTPRTSERS